MKILFVGLGSIGIRHLENLIKITKKNNINVQIDALRSNNYELPIGIENHIENQFTQVTDTYYDIALITNPTVCHYEKLKELQDKVKFFFIEKPIFEKTSYSNIDLGLNSTNSYVACPIRHSKIYKELKNIIKDFKIFSVRITCSSYLPNWRPNIDYRKNYSAITSMGGGVSIDLIHEIDYMVDLFGFPQKNYNICGKFSNLEIDSDDLSVYIVKYEDKICEVHLDYFGRKPTRTIECFTEKGTIIADFINGNIKLPNEQILNFKEEPNEKYVAEIEYFLNLCKSEVDNINDPSKALKVLSISLGEGG